MRHEPIAKTTETSARAERAGTAAAALFAALLGFFMLYGVGFAHIPAAHNAAHDARHSFGFPCH